MTHFLIVLTIATICGALMIRYHRHAIQLLAVVFVGLAITTMYMTIGAVVSLA